jgi:DNA mismatch repair protein MutS2
VNAHALRVLEFDQVLRAVAARCGSALGRDALLARLPGTDLPRLRAELDAVAEAVELHRAHAGWTPPLPPDARDALRVLALEGGVLDAPELLRVLELFRASGGLADALEDGASDAPTPHLELLQEALVQDPDAVRRLEGVVDDDATIRDGASPALKAVRGRIRGARTRIVRRLEAFVASLPDRIRVPDASVSLRDGRYVIQLRREGKSEVGGVIHGESATGGTLFVEPPLALELMNELQELEREESREVHRILRELSGWLRPATEQLEGALSALVRFDTLWARALTAVQWEAHLPELVEPVSEDAGDAGDAGDLVVVRGRHPLLLEQLREGGGGGPVVPFSVALEPEERALVLSGPNTGGKTVFLKALGLVHLLAQSGILPPVGPGTRLPVVRDVFADIGDEQSIAESLSTFSAHLAHAREILDGAGPGTLVLMDEMGTGTDPAEGAALARAMLETLVDRGARAVVTSHLGAMKRLDDAGSGIVNGSLLFDPDRIEPTYEFRKGRPGRSYGLAIARRLGFPGPVLDRAEGYVASGELEVEALLASLEAKETALAEALAEARSARDEAETRLADARRQGAALDARERSAEARAREAARRYLLEARGEVEAAIQELRAAAEGEAREEQAREEREREARRRLETAARSQGEGAKRARGGRKGGAGSASSGGGRAGGLLPPPEPGDRVRIRGSGARGVVREVEDDRVSIEVGALRFEVAVAEVERVAGAEPPAERAARGGGGHVTVPDATPRAEVLLLGLRVDEVEHVLGRALDDAVLGSLPHLRIVHGKGTGAVKARVLELLREDARVQSFRGGVHGEGGAGVTVAELR